MILRFNLENMNEVTMQHVKDYLDQPSKPKVYEFLKRKKAKLVEDYITEKINFILATQQLMDQLPSHPCSSSMFPVFREKFLRRQELQDSEWFRILSSPDILKGFVDITPEILSFVPPEILINHNFVIRFSKYNSILMSSIVRTVFNPYDRIITYSFTGNDLSSEWFYQGISEGGIIDVFAPLESTPNQTGHKCRRKQADMSHFWTLNAELYLDKIQSAPLDSNSFIKTKNYLTIASNQSTAHSSPHDIPRAVHIEDLSHETAEFQAPHIFMQYNQNPQDSIEDTSPVLSVPPTIDHLDSVNKLTFRVVDESLIGKEAIFDYPGYKKIHVRIQNFSYNFEHIYLEVIEDTFPGPDLLTVEVSSISEKLSEDTAWVNPVKLEIIA